MDENKTSHRIQSIAEIPKVTLEKEIKAENKQFSSRSRRSRSKVICDEESDEDDEKASQTHYVKETKPEHDLGSDYNSLGTDIYQSDLQYYLDNDHMLGCVSINDYRSDILMEKTEEEDIVELEAVIKRLNDCYKGSIEASNDSDYTEILMSYFKTNIKLSSLMLNSKSTNKIKFKKLIMNSTSSIQPDCNRSLSISSINEVDLRKIMNNILTSPHRILKEHEQNTLLQSEILTSNNIKTLISENIEADETIKILLTGELSFRTEFIRSMQMFDQISGKFQSQIEVLGE